MVEMRTWFQKTVTYSVTAAMLTAQMAPFARAEESMSEAEAQAAAAQVETSLDQVAAQIESMSDAELRGSMIDRADALEHLAQTSTELGDAERAELSAAAQQLRSDASNPDAQPKKKIVEVLKKIGRAIGKGAVRTVQAVGYVSQSVDVLVGLPFRLVYKFFRGLITGKAHQEYRPISMSGGGDLSYLYYISFVLLFSPDPVTKAVGITMLALGNGIIILAICQDLNEQRAGRETVRFCKNIGKINRVGYEASSAGDAAGAAIHNLFKKRHRHGS